MKKNWFEGKNSQLSFDTSIFAFGIKLQSRYNKVPDFIEMLQCAQELAKSSLEGDVKSMFYDKKESGCRIEIAENLSYDRIEGICQIADETLDIYQCGNRCGGKQWKAQNFG